MKPEHVAVLGRIQSLEHIKYSSDLEDIVKGKEILKKIYDDMTSFLRNRYWCVGGRFRLLFSPEVSVKQLGEMYMRDVDIKRTYKAYDVLESPSNLTVSVTPPNGIIDYGIYPSNLF